MLDSDSSLLVAILTGYIKSSYHGIYIYIYISHRQSDIKSLSNSLIVSSLAVGFVEYSGCRRRLP